jgi:ZIP family zinc transporter
MLEAAFWSFLAACSLLVGVEFAFAVRPGQRTIGLIMAFGAGAMISAIAYELVAEALEADQHIRVVTGMALGSLAFLGGNVIIDSAGGAHRKRSTGKQSEGSPLAIVLGATLDAIPESVIIGLSLVVAGDVSAPFVFATALSNFPESSAATTGLVEAGWTRRNIRLLWLSVVGISVVAGALGFAVFDHASAQEGAIVQGFAAGALLTMLADTMMPEAFEFGGRLVGLATVAGFAVALAISGV